MILECYLVIRSNIQSIVRTLICFQGPTKKREEKQRKKEEQKKNKNKHPNNKPKRKTHKHKKHKTQNRRQRKEQAHPPTRNHPNRNQENSKQASKQGSYVSVSGHRKAANELWPPLSARPKSGNRLLGA
jgi:hypothetical protein